MTSRTEETFFQLSYPETSDDTTHSWDSTFENRWQEIAHANATLCSHAVACDGCVYGCSSEDWLTWRRSFRPHQVTQVVSNHDGSVIAVATDVGSVSLLRGVDGTVLAARKVGNSPPSLAFLNRINEKDSLMIHTDGCSFILVSDIDYSLVQEDETATEAARSMVLTPIKLEEGEVESWSASYSNSATLNLLTVDGGGASRVWSLCFPASGEEQTLKLLRETQLIQDDSSMVDCTLGLCRITVQSTHFSICSMISQDTSSLVWIDSFTGEKIFGYELPLFQKQRARVLCVSSVTNPACGEAGSLAVAVKYSMEREQVCRVYVIQYLVDETMGLPLLSCPHTIFSLPISDSTAQASIACRDQSLSFRLKIVEKEGGCSFHCFSPETSLCEKLVQYNVFLERGQFDQAEEYLVVDGLLGVLSSHSMVCFDPGEPSLRLLKRLVTRGFADAEQIVEPLNRLATKAISSGNVGSFLSNLDLLVSTLNIGEVPKLMVFFEACIASLNKISSGFEGDSVDKVSKKRDALSIRLKTLKFVQNHCIGVPKSPVSLKSPDTLLRYLVDEGLYGLALELCNNKEMKGYIGTDSIVSGILSIPSSVHPKEYISLLSEGVLSNIAINHKLVPRLQVWCTKVAEDLDKNPLLGLDAALLLLETVSGGLKAAQVRTHQSFGSFCPFTSDIRIGKSKRSPRLGTSAEISFSRFEPSEPVSSIEYESGRIPDSGLSVPTIIEESGMGSGATFHGSALNSESEFGEDHSFVDTEYLMRDKLAQARCLADTRSRGVSRDEITLADFSSKGGVMCCAMSLVGIFITKRNEQQLPDSFLSTILVPFCEEYGILSDDVLLSYIEARCKEHDIDYCMVEQIALVAQCCHDPVNKARGVLQVLNSAYVCNCDFPWLEDLTKDSIRWSFSDSKLSAELQESSRLFRIDSIVRKYCGNEARELFRIDNPKHAIRLAKFVSQNSKEQNVIDDILTLCEAFVHLSIPELCTNLIQNALRDSSESSSSLFGLLLSKDRAIAQMVFVGLLAFVEETLQENSIFLNRNCSACPRKSDMIANIIARFQAILCAMIQANCISPEVLNNIECLSGVTSYENLKRRLDLVSELFRNSEIIVSLSELSRPKCLLDVVKLMVGSSMLVCDSEDSHVQKVASLFSDYGSLKDGIHSYALLCVCVELLLETKSGSIVELLRQSDMNTISESIPFSNVCLKLASSCVEKTMGSTLPVEELSRLLGLSNVLVQDFALPKSSDRTIGRIQTIFSFFNISMRTLAQVEQSFSSQHEKCTTTESTILNGGLTSHAPKLHTSWYIGDGLLMPSRESLSFVLDICQETLACDKSPFDACQDLVYLARDHGAHGLCSQILLSCSTLSTLPDPESLQYALSDACTNIVERSIGGTTSGIMSHVVDAQLTLALLPYLSVHSSDRLLKSPLPTAIKTRSYKRLLSIANVGQLAHHAADSDAYSPLLKSPWLPDIGPGFYHLTRHGMWWSYMHGITCSFQATTPFHSEKNIAGELSEWLGVHAANDGDATKDFVGFLRENRNVHHEFDLHEAFQLGLRFAADFGIPFDQIHQSFIELLLFDNNKHGNLIETTATVKSLLRGVRPAKKKVSLLRKCVLKIEATAKYDMDYESHFLVLTLYRDALLQILDHDSTSQVADSAMYESELEMVDRRRDTLEILSAYFNKDTDRVSFPSMFARLPEAMGSTTELIPQQNHVLGRFREGTEASLDPLKPFEPLFRDATKLSSISALAPICFSLGLPTGYVHARALMARFAGSKSLSELPSFLHDVLPTIEKLRQNSDKSHLAEWCAGYYGVGRENERLRCLEIALDTAVSSSIELENGKEKTSNMKTDLDLALERIKSLERSKSSLADQIAVKAALQVGEDSLSETRQLIVQLVNALAEKWENINDDQTPEELVYTILSSSAFLVAKGALERSSAFSVSHIRGISKLVSKACSVLSDHYSHIHTESFVQELVRELLFYGNLKRCQKLVADNGLTVNSLSPFTWDQHCNAEPSIESLSERETAEYCYQSASIQIAFLFSLIERKDAPERNSKPSRPVGGDKTNKTLPRRRGRLLQKLDTLRENPKRSLAFEHARVLLQIVFSKSSITSNLLTFTETPSNGDSPEEKINSGPVTFAMRYRAFRAASVLCPQSVLEQVVQDESLVNFALKPNDTPLRLCTFGSFVAKEIEDLGLQVPHSDLGQLSSMHYPSYARTLWKNTKESGTPYGARFLLLLLDMVLKGSLSPSDQSFVGAILRELQQGNYHRSLLLGVESCLERGCDLDRSFLQTLVDGSTTAVSLQQPGSNEASSSFRRVEKALIDSGAIDCLEQIQAIQSDCSTRS